MKLIFAGLILLFAIGATAQTSKTVNDPQRKLTPGKMREVIMADERQHEAKAPVSPSGNSYNNTYKLPSTSTGAPFTKSKYVVHHHDALLSGLGTALFLSKGTRYTNYSGEAQAYYRKPY